jgi:acetyl esterase/lipase
MNPIQLTISATLLTGILTCADAQSDRQRSYVYKESANSICELDVYFPENHDPQEAKVPGVIFFHGGSWISGTRNQFRDACLYLADRGMVAATASYRMHTREEAKALPKGTSFKRICIIDAKSAIRWMKQHADELGLDPERLVVGGGSAGGHIAVLATTNLGLNDPADSNDFDTIAAAYLLFNPAFAPGDSADMEVDALHHLKPGFAPALIFFGTDDRWMKRAEPVIESIRELSGNQIQLNLADGEGHGYFNSQPWKEKTLLEADQFLVSLGLLPPRQSVVDHDSLR